MTTRVGYSANTSNLIFHLDAALPASYNGAENIIVQGALLSNTSAWAYDNCSVTANTIPAPDGTLSGWKLTSSITGGNNNGFLQQVPVTYSNTVWTHSVYLKQGTSPTTLVDYFIVSPYAEITATVTWGATPSIAYGYAGAANASTRLDSSFTDAGNGWWRIAMTLNTATGTSVACRVYVRGQGTNNVSGEYVYAWCPQLERGYGASAPTFVNTNLLRTTSTSGAYGTSYVGTLAGAVIYSTNPGVANTAAPSFWFNNTSTDAITCYTIPASVFTGSYTVSAWAKLNNINRGNDHAILGHGSAASDQALHLGVRSAAGSNVLYFGFYGDDIGGGIQLVANKWYHLAWSYNATTRIRRMYVNGVADYFGPSGGAYSGTGTNVEIGRYPWATYHYMDGQISQVQIYNVELQQADIVNLTQAYRGRYGV